MNERKGYIKQENNKWFCRVTFTDNLTGKTHNKKRICKSESDAKATLKKLLQQIENEGEKGFEADKVTFNDLCDYYEQHFCQPAQYENGRKISGLRDVGRAKSVLPHFRAFFGHKKIRLITYGDLLSYKRMRMSGETHLKKSRTLSTMNRELGILRRTFSIALSQDWIAKSPFKCGDSLIEPSADRIRERILTADEENRLLTACGEPCRVHIKSLVIALMDTGARRGEMLKLTWNDIDFDKRLITIRSETTKTLSGRKVALTERLFCELSELWQHSDKQPFENVFNIKTFRKSFATACKVAGIKYGGFDGFTVHSLRHGAATKLVKGQLPIQFVAKILGHSECSPRTTFRYITANDETLYKAASILESIQQTSE